MRAILLTALLMLIGVAASADTFTWTPAPRMQACEDVQNNLCMTSGGAVRKTTVMSGVKTNTTTERAVIPTGSKTFKGQVVCTSGACTQTQVLFGDDDNDGKNGIAICTLILSGSPRADKLCSPITWNFSFYYVETTQTSGIGAAGAMYGMY